ncbi:MAG: hypothetical protein ACRDY7_04735 [Acidimicrobiia bacterium]
MSTIWTPSGEYTPRSEGEPNTPSAPPPPPGPPPGGPGREPTPEELEEAAAQVKAILGQPVVEHVASHVMGLFELAALHLERRAYTGGAEAPDLAEASLAVDAMAAVVEGLGERLGRYRPSLEQALSQLRLAYVQASQAPPS